MFVPKRILFLKDAINYEIGKRVYDYFCSKEDTEMIFEEGNIIRKHFDNTDFANYYKEAKRTLILGVKKVGEFQTCKPSAHYQLPLLSGCMGQCEYCYLQTQLKEKPYIKVNVNLEEIHRKASEYIGERPDMITVFEGAATSDPLPVEPYTGILSKTIRFFSESENGRFRFATKFNDVETLLNIPHNHHTEIRFSINTDAVIREFEHHTPSAEKRFEAAVKVLKAGYPVGFLIAPVFLYQGYEADYRALIQSLKKQIEGYDDKVTFEVISHRFTPRAKAAILSVFPETSLSLDESRRSYKVGQFGYGKYTYTKEELNNMKIFFEKALRELFPGSRILYII